jgi:hypothetical protein
MAEMLCLRVCHRHLRAALFFDAFSIALSTLARTREANVMLW